MNCLQRILEIFSKNWRRWEKSLKRLFLLQLFFSFFLYPSIPHDGNLGVLRTQYDKFKNKVVLTEDTIKMADFVVKNNFFEFDRKFYQQLYVTAIGTKSVPPYACKFMVYWNRVLKNTSYKTLVMEKIHWYLFYLDRLRGMFKQIIRDLSKSHPNLKFTYENSKEKIKFFDLVIKLIDGKIVTDLYCKPKNNHQYLHYDSCHDEQIKKSLVFSQTVRFKRIWLQKSDRNSRVKELKNLFSKRGYPEKVISD